MAGIVTSMAKIVKTGILFQRILWTGGKNMLKKLRKRLRQKRLAAAMALVVALSSPAAPVFADVGKQSFNDGNAHTVSDNIAVSDDNGLEVVGNGTVATVTGTKITVTGAMGGTGAIASSLGKITLSDVTISSTGGGIATVTGPPFGFSGEITMTGGSITATGANGSGASASGNGTITLTNVAVNTSGDDSYGVVSQFSWPITNLTMTGGSITTSGTDSYGAYAGATGSIGLSNVAVKSFGARSYGLYVLNADSKVTMSGGSITTNGADAHAVYADDSGAVTLTDVAVHATGSGSFALVTIGNGSITATVNGQDIAGTGGLMTAATGTINLTAYGASRLTGIAGASGGGTANLTLNDSSSWTSSAESYLTNLTLNGGMVVQARGAAGPIKLTVTNSLAGSGGTFRTNANINDISQSDLIVIQGLASGSHRVEAAVVGGYPADLYNTVRVVDVNNALANTATFSGGSDVRAYRYGVTKGSALPAAYSGILAGHENDCYLYNTFAPSTPANAAVGTTLAGSTVWYGELNEIRKRLGDLRSGAAVSGEGFWARAYANEYRLKPGAGQDFDQRLVGFELGSDIPLKYSGGTRHTGWVAGAGWAARTFDLGGHGNTNSLYVGGYASWLKDDGAYWDIVAKHNWFRHGFDAPVLGGGNDSAVYGTTGFGLSVETGRRFERKDGTFFEPQAELAALWTKGRNYATSGGLGVNARAETSLQLRVGAVFGRKTAAEGGTRQVYGKVAWVQELGGENRTTVDGVAFASSLKSGRMVAGAGLTLDTAKSQLYLDVETAWGSRIDKPWGINLGCRWKF